MLQLMFFLLKVSVAAPNTAISSTPAARGLEALHVRNEHGVSDAASLADAGHHFGVVGHLRHPLGRHERGGLDRRETRVLEPFDQLDFHRSRHAPGFVLQAVARCDVDDADFARQAHETSVSNSISSAPSTTWSPALQRTAATVPRVGAVRVCSIFIASRMSSGAPLSTLAPDSTSTVATLPGSGAARPPPCEAASKSCSSGSCSSRLRCSSGRKTSTRLPAWTTRPVRLAPSRVTLTLPWPSRLPRRGRRLPPISSSYAAPRTRRVTAWRPVESQKTNAPGSREPRRQPSARPQGEGRLPVRAS